MLISEYVMECLDQSSLHPPKNSVADPHYVDADPDPAFHFDAGPDLTFHSDADPDLDLTFQFDPDPDPTAHRFGPSNALR
jgi:hypothetical protein